MRQIRRLSQSLRGPVLRSGHVPQGGNGVADRQGAQRVELRVHDSF
ncbi:hypothetical protein [Metallosphaera cuprina]|uniref:Uncharacterized protein n=1 Tax=Metallosphaera cuprina (strain Ar-4) TaxID=1006006 RepID=F4G314_METCR|nr:hypothetical protein [Metallosphaera cuprina]AEB95212.1 hypothetical protein Mcup_1107 [Metallosphaera cuprina Ar-4]